MQCHNTDVILSARFSNKLEPLLGLLWQYEQYTRRYLRAPRYCGVCTATPCGLTCFQCDLLCGCTRAQTVCVHELDDMAQGGSTYSVEWCTTTIGQKAPRAQKPLYRTCQIFRSALHRYIILQESKYRDTGRNSIQKCGDKAAFFWWDTIFQSRHSTLSLLPSALRQSTCD